jgi:hypothetical protein
MTSSFSAHTMQTVKASNKTILPGAMVHVAMQEVRRKGAYPVGKEYTEDTHNICVNQKVEKKVSGHEANDGSLQP